MALFREEQPLAETSPPDPARVLRSPPRRPVPTHACAPRTARSRERRAAARARGCPRARRRARAASHQSIAPAPRATTDSGALSPSQNRASIPPASHDALPPSSALRSYNVTSAPRSRSSVAVARPITQRRSRRRACATPRLFTYSAPPASRNSRDFAAMPAIASASWRRSRVICIEQNFGPHIEQKCATLWLSFGNVSS